MTLNGSKPLFEKAVILFRENTPLRSDILETLTIKATENLNINERINNQLVKEWKEVLNKISGSILEMLENLRRDINV